jgi:hypothetical protein
MNARKAVLLKDQLVYATDRAELTMASIIVAWAESGERVRSRCTTTNDT